MILRMRLMLLILTMLFPVRVTAQHNDFCAAITAILRDAPNQFRDVHGRLIESDEHSNVYVASFVVPGTINSRFVSSMGLFYQGALFQTRNKATIKEVYDKYKTLLGDCLLDKGYSAVLSDNFYPGLDSFKKVAYMPDVTSEDLKSAPGHVTLEVDYYKPKGTYTVLVFIYEH